MSRFDEARSPILQHGVEYWRYGTSGNPEKRIYSGEDESFDESRRRRNVSRSRIGRTNGL
jgi:hypothetical protein